MPYLSSEVVDQARQMDLLTYLRCYEPNELVHYSGDTYTTRTHDSLKISNGKWMWWSKGIGGYCALDYLVKVKNMDFVKAVQLLTGKVAVYNEPIPKSNITKPKLLLLPEKNDSNEKVIEYLFGRGIDLEIINFCIKKELVFESLPHHNVVFIGKDKEGKPRYAAYRATNNYRIMGDATGSDKHFSFRIQGDYDKSLHLFECAIDALSYATLLKMMCKSWRDSTLLSLAGVYAPKKNLEDSKVPAALEQYLKEHPETKRIYLHLDNDKAGRLASRVIKYKLSDKYEVIDMPVPSGKDVNDFLCFKLGIKAKEERRMER